jgi:hypothetical protein
MRQVKVNLSKGYLARNTTLRVGKTISGRRWEIQAYDGRGVFTTDITVDELPIPVFATRRDALAFLDTLPVGSIWATSSRLPSHYVQTANNDAGFVIRAMSQTG